mgnify:CR=1 FL=1
MQDADKMPVILGLTGGIASGKSTVTSMFRELGVVVIDADEIAREVVEPGEPALEEIREAFGAEVITPDGSLDRAALGKIIFSDDDARKKLGQITHPRIGQRMMQKAMDAGKLGHAWVIYDAALLVENGLYKMFDALIVVAVSEETQLERLMQRDESAREDARARIDSQLPLADKVAVADHVIDNNGTRDETRTQVVALHAFINQNIADHGTAKPSEIAE